MLLDVKGVYNFKSKVWIYPGKNAWHFVTLPKDIADEINFLFSAKKRGWGSLKVKVKTGNSEWVTSIFPEKNSDPYLLPLKSDVRKKGGIKENIEVKFTIEII